MRQSADDLIERVWTVPANRAGDKPLVDLLRQDAPHFRGLSAADAEKVRAHILASFEHRSLPAEAIDAVMEELRTSLSPIILAGAARALRGLRSIDPECRGMLVAASARVKLRDEVVRLDAVENAQLRAPRTARSEIASTLALYAEAVVDCCGGTDTPSFRVESPQPISLCPNTMTRAVVEDQSEGRTPLLQLLRDRVSLVAFFYTRCMNPAKCSLTISQLANVARVASTHACGPSLNFLGISYDPDFDSPSRLYIFGRDRGFPFGDDARLTRCIAGWAAIRRMFDLRVGYNEATVNAHAREVFLVSRNLQAMRIDCERLSDPAILLDEISVEYL